MHSRAALSLNLNFRRFQLNRDTEFYVSSIDAETGAFRETVGPFTYENNKAHGRFAVAPMAGNTLLLELFVGPQAAGADNLESIIQLESIVHGYKDSLLTTGRKASGQCNINVACQEGGDWQREVRSVAMLLTGSGQGFCSGIFFYDFIYC